jgi:hypothetical protein
MNQKAKVALTCMILGSNAWVDFPKMEVVENVLFGFNANAMSPFGI